MRKNHYCTETDVKRARIPIARAVFTTNAAASTEENNLAKTIQRFLSPAHEDAVWQSRLGDTSSVPNHSELAKLALGELKEIIRGPVKAALEAKAHYAHEISRRQFLAALLHRTHRKETYQKALCECIAYLLKHDPFFSENTGDRGVNIASEFLKFIQKKESEKQGREDTEEEELLEIDFLTSYLTAFRAEKKSIEITKDDEEKLRRALLPLQILTDAIEINPILDNGQSGVPQLLEEFGKYFDDELALYFPSDLVLLSERFRISRTQLEDEKQACQLQQKNFPHQNLLGDIQRYQRKISSAMAWYLFHGWNIEADDAVTPIQHYIKKLYHKNSCAPPEWADLDCIEIPSLQKTTAEIESEEIIQEIALAAQQMKLSDNTHLPIETVFIRHIETHGLIQSVVPLTSGAFTHLVYNADRKLFLPASLALNQATLTLIPISNISEASLTLFERNGVTTHWGNWRRAFVSDFATRSAAFYEGMRQLESTTALLSKTIEADIAKSQVLLDLYLEQKKLVETELQLLTQWCEKKKTEPRWKKQWLLEDWSFTQERADSLALVKAYQLAIGEMGNTIPCKNKEIKDCYQRKFIRVYDHIGNYGEDTKEDLSSRFESHRIPRDSMGEINAENNIEPETYQVITKKVNAIDPSYNLYAQVNILKFFSETLIQNKSQYVHATEHQVLCYLSDQFYRLRDECSAYASQEEKAAIGIISKLLEGKLVVDQKNHAAISAYQKWLKSDGKKSVDYYFKNTVSRKSDLYALAQARTLFDKIDINTQEKTIATLTKEYLQSLSIDPALVSFVTSGNLTAGSHENRQSASIYDLQEKLIRWLKDENFSDIVNPLGLLRRLLNYDSSIFSRIRETISAQEKVTQRSIGALLVLLEKKEAAGPVECAVVVFEIIRAAATLLRSAFEHIDSFVSFSHDELKVLKLSPTWIGSKDSFDPLINELLSSQRKISPDNLLKLMTFFSEVATPEQRGRYLAVLLYRNSITDPLIESQKKIKMAEGSLQEYKIKKFKKRRALRVGDKNVSGLTETLEKEKRIYEGKLDSLRKIAKSVFGEQVSEDDKKSIRAFSKKLVEEAVQPFIKFFNSEEAIKQVLEGVGVFEHAFDTPITEYFWRVWIDTLIAHPENSKFFMKAVNIITQYATEEAKEYFLEKELLYTLQALKNNADSQCRLFSSVIFNFSKPEDAETLFLIAESMVEKNQITAEQSIFLYIFYKEKFFKESGEEFDASDLERLEALGFTILEKIIKEGSDKDVDRFLIAFDITNINHSDEDTRLENLFQEEKNLRESNWSHLLSHITLRMLAEKNNDNKDKNVYKLCDKVFKKQALLFFKKIILDNGRILAHIDLALQKALFNELKELFNFGQGLPSYQELEKRIGGVDDFLCFQEIIRDAVIAQLLLGYEYKNEYDKIFNVLNSSNSNFFKQASEQKQKIDILYRFKMGILATTEDITDERVTEVSTLLFQNLDFIPPFLQMLENIFQNDQDINSNSKDTQKIAARIRRVLIILSKKDIPIPYQKAKILINCIDQSGFLLEPPVNKALDFFNELNEGLEKIAQHPDLQAKLSLPIDTIFSFLPAINSERRNGLITKIDSVLSALSEKEMPLKKALNAMKRLLSDSLFTSDVDLEKECARIAEYHSIIFSMQKAMEYNDKQALDISISLFCANLPFQQATKSEIPFWKIILDKMLSYRYCDAAEKINAILKFPDYIQKINETRNAVAQEISRNIIEFMQKGSFQEASDNYDADMKLLTPDMQKRTSERIWNTIKNIWVSRETILNNEETRMLFSKIDDRTLKFFEILQKECVANREEWICMREKTQEASATSPGRDPSRASLCREASSLSVGTPREDREALVTAAQSFQSVAILARKFLKEDELDKAALSITPQKSKEKINIALSCYQAFFNQLSDYRLCESLILSQLRPDHVVVSSSKLTESVTGGRPLPGQIPDAFKNNVILLTLYQKIIQLQDALARRYSSFCELDVNTLTSNEIKQAIQQIIRDTLIDIQKIFPDSPRETWWAWSKRGFGMFARAQNPTFTTHLQECWGKCFSTFAPTDETLNFSEADTKFIQSVTEIVTSPEKLLTARMEIDAEYIFLLLKNSDQGNSCISKYIALVKKLDQVKVNTPLIILLKLIAAVATSEEDRNQELSLLLEQYRNISQLQALIESDLPAKDKFPLAMESVNRISLPEKIPEDQATFWESLIDTMCKKGLFVLAKHCNTQWKLNRVDPIERAEAAWLQQQDLIIRSMYQGEFSRANALLKQLLNAHTDPLISTRDLKNCVEKILDTVNGPYLLNGTLNNNRSVFMRHAIKNDKNTITDFLTTLSVENNKQQIILAAIEYERHREKWLLDLDKHFPYTVKTSPGMWKLAGYKDTSVEKTCALTTTHPAYLAITGCIERLIVPKDQDVLLTWRGTLKAEVQKQIDRYQKEPETLAFLKQYQTSIDQLPVSLSVVTMTSVQGSPVAQAASSSSDHGVGNTVLQAVSH